MFKCAFCGVVDLGKPQHLRAGSWAAVEPEEEPAHFQNTDMAQYMTTERRYYKCHTCLHKPDFGKTYNTLLGESYQLHLLRTHPTQLQSLSCLDTSVAIQNQFYGKYAKMDYRTSSLFGSPLVCSALQCQEPTQDERQQLQDLVVDAVANNKIIKRFKTVLESSKYDLRLPVRT